jgi:hypothetical protein
MQDFIWATLADEQRVEPRDLCAQVRRHCLRATNGSDAPVFDKEGSRVGRRMRQNERLPMFLLRAHLPARYRHAHSDLRTFDAPPPPDTLPLAQAIARLSACARTPRAAPAP